MALAAALGVPTAPLRFEGRLGSLTELRRLIEGWAAEPSAVGAAVCRDTLLGVVICMVCVCVKLLILADTFISDKTGSKSA